MDVPISPEPTTRQERTSACAVVTARGPCAARRHRGGRRA
jgi:hypothetical protein